MDADQVYVLLTVSVDGTSGVARIGDSIFVPGGALRQIGNAGDCPVSIAVAMPAGAHVSPPFRQPSRRVAVGPVTRHRRLEGTLRDRIIAYTSYW